MHIIFLAVYIAHNLLEHPQNKLVAVITYVIVDINRHEPHVFFPPLRPWKLYRFNSDCYRHQRLLLLMLNKYILAENLATSTITCFLKNPFMWSMHPTSVLKVILNVRTDVVIENVSTPSESSVQQRCGMILNTPYVLLLIQTMLQITQKQISL